MKAGSHCAAAGEHDVIVEEQDAAVREIIALFAMERHPTAGWIAPHYRDSELWGRADLSSDYHLLLESEPMPPHKPDGIVIWHHYAGAPIEIDVSHGGRLREVSRLGGDFASGGRPQLAVPAYHWQACRSLGPWSLLGRTMSPGSSTRTTLVMDAER